MTQPRLLRLDAFVPYRLSIASNTVSDMIASAYRALFGLTIPEWRLVAILAEHDSISQFGLGAATRMDKVTVSRAAQGLLKRHLVNRSDHRADGRSHMLTLSPQGMRLYAEIAPLALAYEAALIAGLTPEEVEDLKRLLLRLQSAATALAEADPPA